MFTLGYSIDDYLAATKTEEYLVLRIPPAITASFFILTIILHIIFLYLLNEISLRIPKTNLHNEQLIVQEFKVSNGIPKKQSSEEEHKESLLHENENKKELCCPYDSFLKNILHNLNAFKLYITLPRYPTKYFVASVDISQESSPNKQKKRRNNLRQGFRDILNKNKLWWEHFSRFLRVFNVFCMVLAFTLYLCFWFNILLEYSIACYTHGSEGSYLGFLAIPYISHVIIWFNKLFWHSLIISFYNTTDKYRCLVSIMWRFGNFIIALLFTGIFGAQSNIDITDSLFWQVLLRFMVLSGLLWGLLYCFVNILSSIYAMYELYNYRFDKYFYIKFDSYDCGFYQWSKLDILFAIVRHYDGKKMIKFKYGYMPSLILAGFLCIICGLSLDRNFVVFIGIMLLSYYVVVMLSRGKWNVLYFLYTGKVNYTYSKHMNHCKTPYDYNNETYMSPKLEVNDSLIDTKQISSRLQTLSNINSKESDLINTLRKYKVQEYVEDKNIIIYKLPKNYWKKSQLHVMNRPNIPTVTSLSINTSVNNSVIKPHSSDNSLDGITETIEDNDSNQEESIISISDKSLTKKDNNTANSSSVEMEVRSKDKTQENNTNTLDKQNGSDDTRHYSIPAYELGIESYNTSKLETVRLDFMEYWNEIKHKSHDYLGLLNYGKIGAECISLLCLFSVVITFMVIASYFSGKSTYNGSNNSDSKSDYPICNMRLHSGLHVMDLVFLACAAYYPNKTQYVKLNKVYFGFNETVNVWDLDNLTINKHKPAYIVMHHKYEPLDIINIRGTADINDMLQDASLYSEIAVLQTMSYIIPLTTLLPVGFIRDFIRYAAIPEGIIDDALRKYYDKPIYKLAHSILKSNQNRTLLLVGHSLGGGIAEIVGAKLKDNYDIELNSSSYNTSNSWYDRKIYSFGLSSPGTVYTSEKFGFNIESLDKTSISILPRRDPVSMVDLHGGLVEIIECNANNMIGCHSSVRSFCEMFKSCGDNSVRNITFAQCVCGKQGKNDTFNELSTCAGF